MFGPELLLTQGDIAEGDLFNVTWTGSSILSRGCSTVSLQPLKRIVPYRCKDFLWVTTETYCFQITPNLSPGHGSGCSSLRLPPAPTRVRPALLLIRLSALSGSAARVVQSSGVADFSRPRPIPGSASQGHYFRRTRCAGPRSPYVCIQRCTSAGPTARWRSSGCWSCVYRCGPMYPSRPVVRPYSLSSSIRRLCRNNNDEPSPSMY